MELNLLRHGAKKALEERTESAVVLCWLASPFSRAPEGKLVLTQQVGNPKADMGA
jgi:hypothetical protein